MSELIFISEDAIQIDIDISDELIKNFVSDSFYNVYIKFKPKYSYVKINYIDDSLIIEIESDLYYLQSKYINNESFRKDYMKTEITLKTKLNSNQKIESMVVLWPNGLQKILSFIEKSSMTNLLTKSKKTKKIRM